MELPWISNMEKLTINHMILHMLVLQENEWKHQHIYTVAGKQVETAYMCMLLFSKKVRWGLSDLYHL